MKYFLYIKVQLHLVLYLVYSPFALALLIENFVKNTVNLKLTPLFGEGFTPFNEDPSKLFSEYDFIIVGAGPAGCVLANRLTENKNWTVLLIEAGKGENIFNQIPALTPLLQLTEYNWNFTSTPQKYCCSALNNRKIILPQGKAVGGGSSINDMIYSRGYKEDFDKWAKAGNTGWSYKDVLPYFIKSEWSTLRGLEASKYHGKNGPLNIEDVPYRTKLAHAFVTANVEAGLKSVDYNGAEQLGVSYIQATTFKGQRHSAAKAFINPIRNRRNLHILANSRVTKVLFKPKSKKASGVEFLNKRKRFIIRARKEIILSAGPFNTPRILMLSGVGPKEHLEEIDIPVLKNLPVGKTLYDHVAFFGPTYILNSTGNSFNLQNFNVYDIVNFPQGKGKLTSLRGVELLTFLKTESSKELIGVPNIEFLFFIGNFASNEKISKILTNLGNEIYEKVYKPLESISQDTYTTVVILLHPKSHGTLKLQDKNPFHHPLIDPNYLAEDEDVETILSGIKESIRISKLPSMQKLGTRIHDIPFPGCEHVHFGSDNYWRCAIRTLTLSAYHPIATCKMGSSEDPTTIINPELFVHGINRLRAADSSIIPYTMSGHTAAISYMIGEKLSDMIKKDWKNK